MVVCDKVLINATTVNVLGTSVPNQIVAINQGIISWCGDCENIPPVYLEQAKEVIDCQGQLLTPGLIDCHTHLVYAGHRAAEFRLKLEGMSYTQIAQAGGGILSTVKQTRAASEEELIQQSLPRLLALKKEGVTTVEIKSGYGLDLATERKMLRVARQLGLLVGMRIKTTFLGGHTVPPEYANKSQEYVDYLCQEIMPAIKEEGLADAVDVFCETIAFSLAQTEQIYQQALQLQLPIKCHAEQLSNIGASILASKYHALSCDHLEHLDAAGAQALAQAGTVAVLLPGAYYYLKEERKPPITLLRDAKIPIAIATDCNPGSSPTASLLLVMNMACQFFNLTIPEVLTGVTVNAAQALGIEQEVGLLP